MIKTKKVIKIKAKVKDKTAPKFYIAEREGSRCDVYGELLRTKQLKKKNVIDLNSIKNRVFTYRGKKDKLENLISSRVYIGRDTIFGLSKTAKVTTEVIERLKDNPKLAVKVRFV